MPGQPPAEVLDPTAAADPAVPAVPAPTATDEVYDFVHGLLVEIVGEDYLLDTEIRWDSNLQDDLALESLEFVTIAERIVEHYGESVDFVGWLSTLELEQIVKLTVGEIVEFVAHSKAAADG